MELAQVIFHPPSKFYTVILKRVALEIVRVYTHLHVHLSCVVQVYLCVPLYRFEFDGGVSVYPRVESGRVLYTIVD